MTKEEIGKILKNLRINANLTQKEVAHKIGRTQQIIGHWETGYSQPDADTLFVLCDIYGVSADEAFGFKKKKTDFIGVKNGKVYDSIEELPEEAQEELLNFIDLLKFKYGKKDGNNE